MTAYEIGVKSDLFDHRVRANVAAFINDYKNLQRTVSTFVGQNVIQTIDNSADARIQGVELDLTMSPTPGLEFIAGVGYLDAHYTEVRGDLNGDGVVNNVDLNLRLSRVSEWSVSGGMVYDLKFDSGASLKSQVFYVYRSNSAGQDSNSVFYPAFNDLRADITFTLPNKATTVSVFGRNLTDEAHIFGGINVIPSFP